MNESKTFLQIIRENAVVLILTIGGMILSLIVTWESFNFRLNQTEGKVKENSDRITTIETGQNDIKVQLSQIQTDIEWIRQALAK